MSLLDAQQHVESSFPDQRSDLCTLCWKPDSQPLNYQGRPTLAFILKLRLYPCVYMPSRSVVYNSLRPHGMQASMLFRPWDFPGKNTAVGCYFLPQGIFPTQGLNCLPCIGRFFITEPPGKTLSLFSLLTHLIFTPS